MKFFNVSSFFVLVIFAAPVSGQNTLSNFGKSFYISFAPNSSSIDYLALYLTGRSKTQCTINIAKLGYTKTVTINPGAVTTVFLPDIAPFSAEVRTHEQNVIGMAVHIQSDSDIVVYGLTHIAASTDAYLALPETAIGNEYLTLCYQSWIEPLNTFATKTPGQFIAVAIQDSTNIEITPSCKTITGKSAGQPFQIILNRGDVYLVQSDTNSSANDLTGSHITSNKPISLLSGHHDTSIPDTGNRIDGSHTSTNVLIEMLPPVSSWGNSAVVIPFAATSAPDLIRVLSAEDGNTININGADVAILNAGKFYEMQGVSQPLVIHSTNPMLVGQYMHSTIDNLPDGDPSLTVVYPVEQYDTAYTVMNVPDPLWISSFINITTATSNVGAVELDGAIISAASFTPIVGSSYSYARLNVKQGVHNMRAASGFGVTVYALGAFDSYAYPGGTLLKPLVPAVAQLASFDTVLVCKGEDRMITITNPNSVAARVKALTVDESIPNSFVVDASIPLVIAPDSSVQIPIHFTPKDTGLVTGMVTIEFQSPRHQTITLAINAYARKLPLEYSMPAATHLLGGEQTIVPIYAATDLTPAQATGYEIDLTYDPTLIQDIDYSQTGTLSMNGYINVNGNPGSRQLVFVGASPLVGGGFGSLPLLNIIFKSSVLSAAQNPTEKDIPISYNVILQNAALDDACFIKRIDSGFIVIDSTCSNPHLVQDTSAPTGSYIGIVRPNPFSDRTILEYGVGILNANHTSEKVRITLYNDLGNVMRTLADEYRTAGYYTLQIDAEGLPNGVYHVILETNGDRQFTKLLLRR